MLRTLCIATLSAVTLSACKTEKRVEPTPSPVAGPAAAHSDRPPELARPEPSPPAPAAGPAAPRFDPELEAKGHAMMNKLADLFVADAADCEKLAADVKAFAAENKALLSQLATAQGQKSYEDRLAYSKRNAAVQAAAATRMQAAMTACAGHPSLLAAMQDFPGE